MKIGIIGGTFDPLHVSHINIASEAKKQFDLEQIWFMLSPNPPHKNSETVNSFEVRFEMLNIGLRDNCSFIPCDYEYKNGYRYTADTLTCLKKDYPDNEFYFIIGSDSLINIESWYHPEIIFSCSTVLVAARNDGSMKNINAKITSLKEKYDCNIEVIFVEATDISSSEIRMHLSEHKDEIPNQIYKYIKEHNLYQNTNQVKRMNPAEILEDLKKELNPHRYEHTIGVANTAKKMAEALGDNPNTAYLAGILHDCAKCIPDEEKVKLCKDNNIEITDMEMKNQFLLHSKAGAVLARNKYGINDDDVLSAITFHTTGKPNMTLLEKIIFSADYIEPSRNQAPNLDYLRKIAYSDIDLTVYTILRDTLNYLKSKGNSTDNIDVNTCKAYEFYKNVIENR